MSPRARSSILYVRRNTHTHRRQHARRLHVTGRNAAQRGFHPARKPSTGWCKVPPAVLLSPAVAFCTRVSAGMKPCLGRDSSENVPLIRAMQLERPWRASAYLVAAVQYIVEGWVDRVMLRRQHLGVQAQLGHPGGALLSVTTKTTKHRYSICFITSNVLEHDFFTRARPCIFPN